MQNKHIYGWILLLWTASALHAQTQQIYNNNFETRSTEGWRTEVRNQQWQREIGTSATPKGNNNFLGEFGNQSVQLFLDKLPPHDSLTVTFDLLALRSWDGNNDPDIWQLTADDSLLLRTTFSNVVFQQAYPGTYPNTRADARMGATETNALGFTWKEPRVYNGPMDARYQLQYTFPHSAHTLTLAFTALLKDVRPTIENESWGLDNITVEGIRRPHKPTQPRMTGDVPTAKNGTGNKPSYDLSNLTITLQRGACFGTCPIYTVVLKGNGAIEFNGERFVQAQGLHTDTLTLQEVQDLVHAFHTSGFFSLHDSYRNDHISDLPLTVVTFADGTTTKRIEDYYGAPDALRALEHRIDSVLRTQRWITGGNTE